MLVIGCSSSVDPEGQKQATGTGTQTSVETNTEVTGKITNWDQFNWDQANWE